MQSDTLNALLARHVPSYKRTRSEALPRGSAAPAEAAAEAIHADHWRRVAVVAAECIQAEKGEVNEADLEHLLAWWHLRWTALWKLRLFTLVQKEMTGVWHVLDASIDGDGQPLTVQLPFALTVLYAQAYFACGQQRRGIEMLWARYAHCQRAAAHDSAVWNGRRVRVGLLLASALAEIEAYDAAASVADALSERLPRPLVESDALTALTLARIYIQMGCLASADELVAAASHAPKNAYDGHAALARLVREPHTHVLDAYADDADQSLANAAAVDAFYRGDLDQGTAFLEKYMQAHPTTFAMARGLGGNLVTLHTMGPHKYVSLLTQRRTRPPAHYPPRRRGRRRRSDRRRQPHGVMWRFRHPTTGGAPCICTRR